ncbi:MULTISPECIES: hypothetical protein [Bacillus]|uniref:hypothetical protein n=1 Tax=Bacillus TaxID=1386 RepID=UPI001F58B8B0|nr:MULTISPECIES: hypothetical protein [Bacillus cereus group]USL15381.1 hypothetical protein LIT28_09290 [Bacillus thuringiensis]
MEELDLYSEYIERIAKIKKWELIDLAYFFKEELKTNNQLKDSIIPTRQILISEDDRNGVFFFLQNNILEGDEYIQLVVSSIIQDVLSISKEHHAYLSFEQYHSEQTVFKKFPELLNELREKSNRNKDLELIKLNVINFNPMPNLPKYRTCKYKEHFLFINEYLDSRIPRYLIDKYGTEDLYIRIEPYMLSNDAPPMALEEEFLRPPNPKWIERLKIYPGKHEGCEIFLPDLNGEDIAKDEKKKMQYWEYNIKKIRRLETNATMKNEGIRKHFSMSLEELSEESLSEGILVGRMIHLDAIDSYDTSFDKIRLNHLDLAINIYKNEKINERKENSLASGGVITDASYRTHLIRADNIMFSDLLDIARLFFKSETMVEEWIDKQFEFMKK